MLLETSSLDMWLYPIGTLMLLGVWAIVYVLRPDLRRRMVAVGVMGIPVTFEEYFFLQDYWRPPLVLPFQVLGHTLGCPADVMLAFTMAGLATCVYPILTRRTPLVGVHPPSRRVVVVAILLAGGFLIAFTTFFHLNSIFSSALGLVLAAAMMLVVRRVLWLPTLVAGLSASLILAGTEYALSYAAPQYLARYWLLYHTAWGTALLLGRVPVTEAIWGFAAGLAFGPLYEVYNGAALISAREAKLAVV